MGRKITAIEILQEWERHSDLTDRKGFGTACRILGLKLSDGQRILEEFDRTDTSGQPEPGGVQSQSAAGVNTPGSGSEIGTGTTRDIVSETTSGASDDARKDTGPTLSTGTSAINAVSGTPEGPGSIRPSGMSSGDTPGNGTPGTGLSTVQGVRTVASRPVRPTDSSERSGRLLEAISRDMSCIDASNAHLMGHMERVNERVESPDGNPIKLPGVDEMDMTIRLAHQLVDGIKTKAVLAKIYHDVMKEG